MVTERGGREGRKGGIGGGLEVRITSGSVGFWGRAMGAMMGRHACLGMIWEERGEGRVFR